MKKNLNDNNLSSISGGVSGGSSVTSVYVELNYGWFDTRGKICDAMKNEMVKQGMPKEVSAGDPNDVYGKALNMFSGKVSGSWKEGDTKITYKKI